MIAKQIAPQVAFITPLGLSNVYFVGQAGRRTGWTLVDAGIPGQAATIRGSAEARFGVGACPDTIVLTHGHFDHYGSALDLATFWDVPIYAPRLDLPYLTGRSMMPPGDPTAGGFFAFMYRFFPNSGTDLGARVVALPDDGAVPSLPDWRWYPTPGHTPGQVALFRETDRCLLSADAVLTVDLDSAAATLTMAQSLAHAPTPATYDWIAARHSTELLAGLRPYTIGAGHGIPMSGPRLADQLSEFADAYIAPLHGRYVPEPAITDENGIEYLPPPVPDPLPRNAAVAGILAGAVGTGLLIGARGRRKRGGA